MRFSAYARAEPSSVTTETREKAPLPRTTPSTRVSTGSPEASAEAPLAGGAEGAAVVV